MFRIVMGWVMKAVLALAVLFVAVYVGDWVVYHLRGAPQSKVTVNRYVPIPLKGNRTEFDYLGQEDQPCSVSLFAQSGESACWRLRKNPNPGLTM